MKKSGRTVIIIICAVVAVCCAAYLVYHFVSKAADNNKNQELESRVSAQTSETTPATASGTDAATVTVSDEETSEYVSPIDFTELKAINPEAYAWITMENTDMSYPIVQHADLSNRDYYLTRDLEGNYLESGTIYTIPPTALDFSDNVTIIYGHNKSKFEALRNFRDKSYWEDHSTFTIYTEETAYTYRVFSAKVFSNVYIPSYIDLYDDAQRQDLIDSLLEVSQFNDCVDETVKVTAEDKIAILSTCVNNDNSRRYLISGVLVED